MKFINIDLVIQFIKNIHDPAYQDELGDPFSRSSGKSSSTTISNNT